MSRKVSPQGSFAYSLTEHRLSSPLSSTGLRHESFTESKQWSIINKNLHIYNTVYIQAMKDNDLVTMDDNACHFSLCVEFNVPRYKMTGNKLICFLATSQMRWSTPPPYLYAKVEATANSCLPQLSLKTLNSQHVFVQRQQFLPTRHETH